MASGIGGAGSDQALDCSRCSVTSGIGGAGSDQALDCPRCSVTSGIGGAGSDQRPVRLVLLARCVVLRAVWSVRDEM